ncbi:MAG: hypothetical protein H6624_00890 [Bdellovibrionaceae bacterium]|nr:hypothetical protein [Pseudobdellovibrionaceae bacterium]
MKGHNLEDVDSFLKKNFQAVFESSTEVTSNPMLIGFFKTIPARYSKIAEENGNQKPGMEFVFA